MTLQDVTMSPLSAQMVQAGMSNIIGMQEAERNRRLQAALESMRQRGATARQQLQAEQARSLQERQHAHEEALLKKRQAFEADQRAADRDFQREMQQLDASLRKELQQRLFEHQKALQANDWERADKLRKEVSRLEMGLAALQLKGRAMVLTSAQQILKYVGDVMENQRRTIAEVRRRERLAAEREKKVQALRKELQKGRILAESRAIRAANAPQEEAIEEAIERGVPGAVYEEARKKGLTSEDIAATVSQRLMGTQAAKVDQFLDDLLKLPSLPNPRQTRQMMKQRGISLADMHEYLCSGEALLELIEEKEAAGERLLGDYVYRRSTGTSAFVPSPGAIGFVWEGDAVGGRLITANIDKHVKQRMSARLSAIRSALGVEGDYFLHPEQRPDETFDQFVERRIVEKLGRPIDPYEPLYTVAKGATSMKQIIDVADRTGNDALRLQAEGLARLAGMDPNKLRQMSVDDILNAILSQAAPALNLGQ